MSIADKEKIISSNNLLIAENQQKVYNAGYEQGKAEGSTDSYYDTFWDWYQDNGARTNYEQAFFMTSSFKGWDLDVLKPKYNFKVDNANSMFRGIMELTDFNEFLENNNVTFEFIVNPTTQKLATAGYMFSGCNYLTNIPTLDLQNVSNITYIFNACYKLDNIRLVNLQRNTVIDGAFSSCKALKNLTVEGEIGVTINLRASSKLTVESAKSVLTHLVNYAGTENEFVNKVTFHSDVWVRLDALGNDSPNGNTWREYVNDLGWNAS